MPSVIRFAWQDGRRRAMEQTLAVDFNMSFTFALSSLDLHNIFITGICNTT
jgi:hypothetical protein